MYLDIWRVGRGFHCGIFGFGLGFFSQEFAFMKPKRKKAKDVGGLKDAQGPERLKAV